LAFNHFHTSSDSSVVEQTKIRQNGQGKQPRFYPSVPPTLSSLARGSMTRNDGYTWLNSHFSSSTQQITTLLFDCDNTLVLSEELAFEACAELINEICEKQGVDKRFTGPSLIGEFVGQNFRGMLTSLQSRYGIVLTPEELEKYVTAEEDAVIAKLVASAQPCAGVDDQLAALAAEGKYKLAVVSSSAKRRVLASIKKVDQDKYFPEDLVFSAATSLPKPTSKPDPAIYLHAMKVIGVSAEECVAIEDSKSGTLSGTRAGIKVVGYVGPYPDDKKDEMRKVLTDAGAVVMMTEWDEFPSMLEKIEAM
jgi:beta-phosphoglucomutase-like phosphatase (HAD superfamily)